MKDLVSVTRTQVQQRVSSQLVNERRTPTVTRVRTASVRVLPRHPSGISDQQSESLQSLTREYSTPSSNYHLSPRPPSIDLIELQQQQQRKTRRKNRR